MKKVQIEFDLTKTENEVSLSVKCGSKKAIAKFEKVFESILQDLIQKLKEAEKS